MPKDDLNVAIFLSVRDRYRCTVACLNSLAETTKGQAHIFLYDNASGPDAEKLQQRYGVWLRNGKVA